MEGENRRRIWWLPDAKEAVAFLIGSFILIYETVLASSAQTVLVVTGAALMGVLGSGYAQRALKKLIEE